MLSRLVGHRTTMREDQEDRQAELGLSCKTAISKYRIYKSSVFSSATALVDPLDSDHGVV